MLPIVATLLSSGLSILGNAVLAKGKEAIEEKLGVALPENGQLTSEALSQLRIKEMEHEEWLLEAGLRKERLELDREALYLGDTSDARKREIALATAADVPLLNKLIVPVLALVVLIGGGIVLLVTEEPDVRMAAISLMTLVLSYYFGTSSSSQQKQLHIERLTK